MMGMKRRFRNGYCLIGIVCLIGTSKMGFTQDVTITINASQDKRAVSPYIYGANNWFDKPAQFYKDAGLRMARTNGGNNATKYNWRKKLSSHPDWYNNVYANDWDKTSIDVSINHPNLQVMWAFQLLGRVASSTEYNFDDWAFNQANWWEGLHQNLAGGGIPNTENPNEGALVEGDIDLYTVEWPADSTVAILDHWFGEGGLGLDKNQFRYWSMDNEVDIWNGTHDDIMSDGLLPASEFMDRYIEVAKKARAKFPEIKICGPVTTSEWQWYKWGDEAIVIDGKYYCWLEYFIKRLADEEDSTGIRLIDVVDLHNYPYASSNSQALQVHRMYYDKSYVYPGANGVKTINGGWDNINKEYIFTRINDWLIEYFGEDHGITCGISEWSPASTDPSVVSVVYASHLGTFANNGVELFTPWTWEKGMWETLHLFSHYAQNFSVSSTSSLENTVSAYTTVNETTDSMTVIIVNRDINSSREVNVNINDFPVNDGVYKTLQLASLPSSESFKSHTNNALSENGVNVSSNSFTITVPALSTTAVLFPSEGVIIEGIEKYKNIVDEIGVFPNPVTDKLYVRLNSKIANSLEIKLFDQGGKILHSSKYFYNGISPVEINTSSIQTGFYFISVKNNKNISVKSFAVFK